MKGIGRNAFVFAAVVVVGLIGTATAKQVAYLVMHLQPSTPGTPQPGHTNITGTAIAAQFQGGGSGLTGLSASNLAGGTVADARLSSNVALLAGVGQTFTTPHTFSATQSFTNATVPFSVTSTGLVGNLNADLLDGQTGSFYQNASNLNAGTIADARLGANVALLATNQTFTGQKTFSQFPSFSNATVPFIVTSSNLVGNLNVQYLNGQPAASTPTLATSRAEHLAMRA